jgi:hypothetical protein
LKNLRTAAVALMSLFFLSLAQANVHDGDAIDFQATLTQQKGCVTFDDLMVSRNFPDYEQGIARLVRFYAAQGGIEKVTLESKQIELTVSDDNLYLEGEDLMCGLESGKEYFFKAGMLTEQKGLIFFTPDSSFDAERQSLVAP